MRVLVATDLSESADEAIRQAQAWVGSGGVLAACHVLPNVQAMNMLFPQRTEEGILESTALSARADVAVRERVSSITGRAPDQFEVFADQGIDYAEIVRRASAWKADLLVVGSHGLTGLKRILLGSVSERVARHAPCPVLVARSGPEGGPILVATDLSEPSLPALSAAHAAAVQRKAQLIAVHVVDFGSSLAYAAAVPFGMVPAAHPAEVVAEVESAAKIVLEGALNSIGAKGEAIVLHDDPAAAIVREAEAKQAQLVVVATHGRTGLAQILLGSVAEKIARMAPCSVLIVRLARA